jgi:L-ribulose-5-phosphate 4-epimerase
MNKEQHMLEQLKREVCDANLELWRRGIVIYTWGNVSAKSQDGKYMIIKPSGVSYENMKMQDMVVVRIEDGVVMEGNWKPSSDTDTHLEIYREHPSIGGVAHTHSVNATAFAQAGMAIPASGTTHADYFYGDVPCTRDLTESEVMTEYEKNTGSVINETLSSLQIDDMAVPGILVKNHGPFTWGKNAEQAVYHAVVLETIAEMTLKTLMLNPKADMPQYVIEKHYMRKHGPDAYYGQDKRGSDYGKTINCFS